MDFAGMQSYVPEIMGKRLQMLRELNPAFSRVAVLRRYLWHAGHSLHFKTAKALGLTIPTSILLLADRVIQ